MLARVVRGGVVEAVHEGAVAAVDLEGRLVASWGDVDRPFLLRSAAKPFQAALSQEVGGALPGEWLAVASASHGAQPVHVALVRSILEEAGLTEEALACPPAWPAGEGARRRVAADGHRRPRPLWHNCSGKHAAMLRACRAAGWPTDSYTSPDHPLQRRVAGMLAEVTGGESGPPAVDGCGVPTFPATVVGLSRAFARLVSDDRWRPVAEAMHRFPALVSDAGRLDARLATCLHAVAKGGAEGCLGVGVFGRMAVAVKCWDGSSRGVQAGMLAALAELGLLPGIARRRLADLAAPHVYGGGKPAGRVEPALEPR